MTTFSKFKKFISVTFTLLAVVLIGSQNIALAFAPGTDINLRSIYLDSAWYDSSKPCSVGGEGTGEGSAVDLSGTNVETAFKYFAGNGYTGAQAAGIVGNMMRESGPNINPTALNSIGAYGI